MEDNANSTIQICFRLSCLMQIWLWRAIWCFHSKPSVGSAPTAWFQRADDRDYICRPHKSMNDASARICPRPSSPTCATLTRCLSGCELRKTRQPIWRRTGQQYLSVLGCRQPFLCCGPPRADSNRVRPAIQYRPSDASAEACVPASSKGSLFAAPKKGTSSSFCFPELGHQRSS